MVAEGVCGGVHEPQSMSERGSEPRHGPLLVVTSLMSVDLPFLKSTFWSDSRTATRLGFKHVASHLCWCLQSGTKSLWRVEPVEGDIPPGSELALKVVARLNDTFSFKDTLTVSVQHGQRHTVALSAVGTGSPVTSDQPFAPSIDLGTCLRY